MAKRLLSWAMPGIVFSAAFAISSVVSTASGDWKPKDPAPLPPPADPPSPLEIDTRLHGCQKLTHRAIGAFLQSRGVDLKSGTAATLYSGALDSLGVPKVDSRAREKSFHTTAAATKLFDIFLAAAPQIIANMGDAAKAPACVLDGTTKPMFDPNDGSCVYESVSCLLGRPAQPNDMALCNQLIKEADPANMNDVSIKRQIAVGALLSAGHTCE
jgi:hypothetical protein